MRRILFSLTFLLIAFATVLAETQAQSKKALETERKEILKRIKKTNEILQKTQSDKSRLISSISSTEQRIRQNENLLSVIEKEIKILNDEIEESSKIIAAMQKDLSALKEDYASNLLATYKLQNSFSKPVLLFASANFNQLLTRVFFFRKMNSVRREQIVRIESVRKAILLRKKEFEKSIEEKNQLSSTKKIQTSQLALLKEEQNTLITVVKKKEREILQELRTEKNALNELDKLVSSQITSSRGEELLAPEEKDLSIRFTKNRGRLPWPVRDGFISSRFGLQPFAKNDEALKEITIMKLGVDIRTEPNENVRAIFYGTVVDVSNVAGRGGLIIIQHGNYYSVYSKVKDILVNPGDKVKIKQKIASVLTQEDGISELEFQLWKAQDKLDPEKWLAK
jgi:septal ring factor EnvC (AmiA/AmiB activator)